MADLRASPRGPFTGRAEPRVYSRSTRPGPDDRRVSFHDSQRAYFYGWTEVVISLRRVSRRAARSQWAQTRTNYPARSRWPPDLCKLATYVADWSLGPHTAPPHTGRRADHMFTKKGDAAVLAKLGDAPPQYREIGERLHRIIRESAPSLEPIVRWGLPFYVKNGKDVCYIKPGKTFIAF